ncbi:alpha/beta hydrolase [Prosthecobacter sp.]|uniref:alpha/beta hydrolase n=1 Tax=Prosthecobacter sp. TaxID=1965333 RepID=UPI002ABC337F|nr:alpha/beta hydrolase [Prosthecobacter sp.]MDZ4401504.1 alpha/beta hydrolase [Prosthecobacter sp.]
MTLWKRLLRLVAIAILTPAIFLLGCQSSLIYHPNPCRPQHERMLSAMQGARVRFTTSQGTQTAFYIPPRASTPGLPPTIWLCFGGNGALALDWLHFTDAWDEQFAYLLVDYPGYGDCEGAPTPGRIRESSKAAFEALAKHLNTTKEDLQPRIAVLGHSLGAAAALMAAEDLDVRRAVLLSPFTTMTDMGRLVLGWPLCYLNLHRFDNRKTLRHVASRTGARLVIFHGAADEVIPAHMGRELAVAHPQVVTFHEVPDAHHNDILALISDRVGKAMTEVAGVTAQ